METSTMGRVITAATIENLGDLWAVNQGLKTPDQIRRIAIADALVDTGAVVVSRPSRMIKQLGLAPVQPKEPLTAEGTRKTTLYEAVRLTIQDRFCSVDVLEVPDDVPVLIGQVPLEVMDFVVDPRQQQLIGNPAHGGKQMLEMY